MPGPSSTPRVLNPDYRDILSIFADEAVEFLVVGAYALAAHGLPRATGDIDLWVRCSRENAERVYRSLARFGAPLSQVSVGDFTEPNLIFQIGLVPRRVDVLTSISGVEFEEAWLERKQLVLEGIAIPVLSRRLLIKNKRATGRAKDEIDARWLEGNAE